MSPKIQIYTSMSIMMFSIGVIFVLSIVAMINGKIASGSILCVVGSLVLVVYPYRYRVFCDHLYVDTVIYSAKVDFATISNVEECIPVPELGYEVAIKMTKRVFWFKKFSIPVSSAKTREELIRLIQQSMDRNLEL